MSSNRHTRKFNLLAAVLAVAIGSLARTLPARGDTEMWDGKLLQYGSMHDAIGAGHDQGRVTLHSLIERPHFFGVAALANLAGEATIYDGTVTLTSVDATGKLAPRAASTDAQATLLVGAYVPTWSEHEVAADIGPDAFDDYIADVASRAGVDTGKPFVFTVEGNFAPVRLHVINGAAPCTPG